MKMKSTKRGGRRMENVKENELNEETLKELSNNKGDED